MSIIVNNIVKLMNFHTKILRKQLNVCIRDILTNITSDSK